MATVYRASDLKHGRTVAVKVLHPDVSATLDTERFLREIGILARLNHPHILPLYDSGEADGLLYYVMPVVPGGSLRARIARDGRLAQEEAYAIMRDLTAALEHAHGEGVIHRDLKPENILLNRGEALIADFGIALPLTGDSPGQRMTQVGLSLGTPEYMSPEQASGEEQLDSRSDIYALGCMMFEMLTGQPPFTGKSARAVIIRQMIESAPLVTVARPEVGRAAGAAIARALAKEPADRFDTVRAFAEALVAREVAPAVIRSIAVLPLDNLSHDPAQEFFADGLTEALITDLAKVGALRVTSRTSVMRYKQERKPLPEIARELNVDAVIEGSVLRVGDQVRITAQLIQASTDGHLWAESYDRPVTDVLALLSEVARTIATAVQARLTPQEEARLATRAPVNAAAHEAYLKGRYLWNQRGAGIGRSMEFFERALAHDAAYAPAHAGLANAYALLGFYGYVAPREVMPKAKESALHALALDETLAEAHACLGYVRTIYDWDWAGAERSFQRAIELDPNLDIAHYWHAVWLQVMGRMDEAIAETRHALERDPLSAYMQNHLGTVLLGAGRYDEARDQLLATLELEPRLWIARLTLGLTYYQLGRVDDALREIERAAELSQRNAWPLTVIGQMHARGGNLAATRAVLAELEERRARQYVPANYIASLHAALGEGDEALRWLELAYDERAPQIPFEASNSYSEWTFGWLRSDPRFQQLTRRLGLPDVS